MQKKARDNLNDVDMTPYADPYGLAELVPQAVDADAVSMARAEADSNAPELGEPTQHLRIETCERRIVSGSAQRHRQL